MKVIAKNRRAFHDYEIIERITAGISLLGHEVKSVRAGQISLKGSFVHFQNHEAYLVNAHIRRYSHAANLKEHDPTRSRKLLLHRKQIDNLEAEKRGAGLAVVPVAVGVENDKLNINGNKGNTKQKDRSNYRCYL